MGPLPAMAGPASEQLTGAFIPLTRAVRRGMLHFTARSNAAPMGDAAKVTKARKQSRKSRRVNR
jgi:hypothetical protein